MRNCTETFIIRKIYNALQKLQSILYLSFSGLKPECGNQKFILRKLLFFILLFSLELRIFGDETFLISPFFLVSRSKIIVKYVDNFLLFIIFHKNELEKNLNFFWKVFFGKFLWAYRKCPIFWNKMCIKIIISIFIIKKTRIEWHSKPKLISLILMNQKEIFEFDWWISSGSQNEIS